MATTTSEYSELVAERSHGDSTWRKRFILSVILGAGLTFIFLAVSVTFIGLYVSSLPEDDESTNPKPDNLIFFISDGFGPASVTFARVVNGGERSSLSIDSIIAGTIRTFSNNSLVTDSAAAATAYACGYNTYNGAIGVFPSGYPCGTILEAAHRKGMATGIVVTSTVSNATPGAFTAHVPGREDEYSIALQQSQQGIDVIFGGGQKMWMNTTRFDKRDLLQEMRDQGYQVLLTLEEFNTMQSTTPVIGLFASGNLAFAVDRNPLQPTLPQMVSKALHLLANSERGKKHGFFLMVEGSRIDMAAHSNDPAGHAFDIIAYAQAIDIAMTWADVTQDDTGRSTLILSTSDHETGGLALGRANLNGSYPAYEWKPDVVRMINASAERMADMVLLDGQNLTEVLMNYTGLSFAGEQLTDLQQAQASGSNRTLALAIGRQVSYDAGIGWTTPGHTGVDVNLYVHGSGRDAFRGNWINVDINSMLCDMLDLDVRAVTLELNNGTMPPIVGQEGFVPPRFEPEKYLSMQ